MRSLKKSLRCKYRTPNIFRRKIKHKIAKIKIHATIKQYGKTKKEV